MRVPFSLLASLLFAVLLALSPSARAEDNGIEVQQGWARATPGALKIGAAYFTVVNKGSAPDRLLSISSPIAEMAILHEQKMEDGVMKMRPLGAVDLAPGASLVLQPSGNHLMLEGLKHPLKEGEHFPLILSFAKAGKKEIDVAVGKAGAMGPAAGMDMGHMNMAH
jgi:copper(I)-binding protein